MPLLESEDTLFGWVLRRVDIDSYSKQWKQINVGGVRTQVRDMESGMVASEQGSQSTVTG